ncbi:hypothetical protein Tco_1193971 [Tanacetum coccineum]
MYTTSITKTKAARYEIVGIEDMTLTLWSTIKHVYDKDAKNRIKHWGERRKLCVSVKKLHGYGHLEEIVVKRAYRRLYKFKEGNFVDLHLNNIEGILLLVVQHKLFHLNDSDIVGFNVALRMFTRSLIIKRHVEDLQLGVESYQKKLNITAPQKTFLKIEFKELYTPSYKPPGVIYEDLNKQKRVMWADELYKYSDGTLKTVRDELHHRILNFCLGYNDEMSRRNQNWKDLPRDIPLDRIEVLRYDTKGVKVRKGKMQTKTELTLEQTQQGVSNEVLIVIMDPVMQCTTLPSHSSDNGNPSRANIKQALWTGQRLLWTVPAVPDISGGRHAYQGAAPRIGFEGLGGASKVSSRKGLVGCGESVWFEEGGKDCGFYSNEDKVVPKVDDVSLVDGVFDGAFGGDGDDDFVMGKGVVVSSSSFVRSTNSFLGGMIVILALLEGFDDKA